MLHSFVPSRSNCVFFRVAHNLGVFSPTFQPRLLLASSSSPCMVPRRLASLSLLCQGPASVTSVFHGATFTDIASFTPTCPLFSLRSEEPALSLFPTASKLQVQVLNLQTQGGSLSVFCSVGYLFVLEEGGVSRGAQNSK